jgi:hypothetical protein
MMTWAAGKGSVQTLSAKESESGFIAVLTICEQPIWKRTMQRSSRSRSSVDDTRQIFRQQSLGKMELFDIHD